MNVKNWILDIEKFGKESVLKFLIGNKCDLENQRKIKTEEGQELGK